MDVSDAKKKNRDAYPGKKAPEVAETKFQTILHSLGNDVRYVRLKSEFKLGAKVTC
jgi:hypothetical protein